MIRRTLTLFGVLLGAAAVAAADLPAAAEFDRQVIDTLKAVHNDGADLYNTGNPEGCLRVYQGALTAVGPLLNHHPELQKDIQDGLTDAGRLDGVRAQAFKLHELIETVRATLKDEIKAAAAKPPEPKKPEPTKPEPKKPEPNKPEPNKPEPKKPEPKKPEPEPKKPEPEPKKPEPKKPDPKKPEPEPKKPEPAPTPKPVDPMPKPEMKKPDPKPADPVGKGSDVSGGLTVDGKPAGDLEITFVTLGSAKPLVFTAEVKKGAYKFTDPLPPGEYAVMVTGGSKAKVADKYQTVQSSGLTAEVKQGDNTFDFELKSK